MSVAAPGRPANPDRPLLDHLRAELDATLAALLPPGAPVALVGIPLWTNVGDHAIFLGTLDWLRRNGHPLVHAVADEADYSPAALRRASGEGGVIMLSGGATVGDTWPRRQAFRERLLACSRDLPVLQLPQSIHFGDDAARDRAAAAFAAHPRFTLLARDADSAERARALGVEPVLAPDIALSLGPLPRPRDPNREVVELIRRDRESALPGHAAAPAGSVDWADPDPLRRRIGVQAAHAASGRLPWADRVRGLALDRYVAYSERRLRAGAALLSAGRAVVSDRIHAHIICLLLGIPHAVLDSSYGKVGSFVGTWTAEAALAHRAASLEEGVALARRLAG